MKTWQKIVCYVNDAASVGLLHNTNVTGATYYVFRADKTGQTLFCTDSKNVYLGMGLSTKMMNLCLMVKSFYQAHETVNIPTVATLHTSAKKERTWQTSH